MEHKYMLLCDIVSFYFNPFTKEHINDHDHRTGLITLNNNSENSSMFEKYKFDMSELLQLDETFQNFLNKSDFKIYDFDEFMNKYMINKQSKVEIPPYIPQQDEGLVTILSIPYEQYEPHILKKDKNKNKSAGLFYYLKQDNKQEYSLIDQTLNIINKSIVFKYDIMKKKLTLDKEQYLKNLKKEKQDSILYTKIKDLINEKSKEKDFFGKNKNNTIINYTERLVGKYNKILEYELIDKKINK